MSWACVGLPSDQLPLAVGEVLRTPWLRESKAAQISAWEWESGEVVVVVVVCWRRRRLRAMRDMDSWVWCRPWRRCMHVSGVEGGWEERPYIFIGSPLM